MNYLKDTGAELSAILSELDEEPRKKVVRYVQAKILKSYRNGIEAGSKPQKSKGRKFTNQ